LQILGQGEFGCWFVKETECVKKVVYFLGRDALKADRICHSRLQRKPKDGYLQQMK
jgi:hypothetical protein